MHEEKGREWLSRQDGPESVLEASIVFPETIGYSFLEICRYEFMRVEFRCMAGGKIGVRMVSMK